MELAQCDVDNVALSMKPFLQGEGSCILWTGSTIRGFPYHRMPGMRWGYEVRKIRWRYVYARDIPNGYGVYTSCSSPKCVNARGGHVFVAKIGLGRAFHKMRQKGLDLVSRVVNGVWADASTENVFYLRDVRPKKEAPLPVNPQLQKALATAHCYLQYSLIPETTKANWVSWGLDPEAVIATTLKTLREENRPVWTA